MEIDWRSRRHRAHTFLLTVGAKALVLAEKGQEQAIVLRSLDEELAIKQEMLLEEQTKAFKRDMHLSPGIRVLKRGRNGSEREVFIRYAKPEATAVGFCITWKSTRLGRAKYFDLSSLRGVEVFGGDDGNGEPNCADYVQLQNHDRRLLLKFQVHDRPAFLHHIKSLTYRKDR
jgi:hypothetical protein